MTPREWLNGRLPLKFPLPLCCRCQVHVGRVGSSDVPHGRGRRPGREKHTSQPLLWGIQSIREWKLRENLGLAEDGLPLNGNLVPLLGLASAVLLAGTWTPSTDDDGVVTDKLVIVRNVKGHVGIHHSGGAWWWWEVLNGLGRRFWSALEWEQALLKGLGPADAEWALWGQRLAQVSPDGRFGKWIRFHSRLASLTLHWREKQNYHKQKQQKAANSAEMWRSCHFLAKAVCFDYRLKLEHQYSHTNKPMEDLCCCGWMIMWPRSILI